MQNVLSLNNFNLSYAGYDLTIFIDPYNPLNLPAYTIRLLYKDGVTPTFNKGTGVQVSQSPNIWDLTYNTPDVYGRVDWNNLLDEHTDLLEVLGANTTGVWDMTGLFVSCSSLVNVVPFDTSKTHRMELLFAYCSSLTTVPLLDTSNVDMGMTAVFMGCTNLIYVPTFNTSKVTNLNSFFANCTSLKSVPLLDTSKVIKMNDMLRNCYNVESGALALYQQASTQTNPPTEHSNTFTNCGRDTTTGAAELAQIPSDWK